MELTPANRGYGSWAGWYWQSFFDHTYCRQLS